MRWLIVIFLVSVVLGGWFWFLTNGTTNGPTTDEVVTMVADTNAALTPREPVRADGTFTIVTSFYPLQFALERIVGEQATVINIGAGRDPHDYQPSAQDMTTLLQADLMVLQGAGLEPWGEKVVEQLQAADVPVVIVTEQLTLLEGGGNQHDDDSVHNDEAHEEDYTHHNEEMHTDERKQSESLETVADRDEHNTEDVDTHDHEDGHDNGGYDPHTWLDPILFSETVAHLAEVLATLDPEFAATYNTNAAELQTELAALHAQFTAFLQNCRYDTVITSHDFLGYVANRYHFTVRAIAGLSTQDTPSAVVLAELRDKATAGVGAILLEENAIAAYGETLARETGLPVYRINPIAFLVPAGENYLTLHTKNASTLARALGCAAELRNE